MCRAVFDYDFDDWCRPSEIEDCLHEDAVRVRVTVRARGGEALLSFSTVNWFCMALLYERAGRLTVRNGGFRPGQGGRAKSTSPGQTSLARRSAIVSESSATRDRSYTAPSLPQPAPQQMAAGAFSSESDQLQASHGC
jgi:hypothetical protein